MRQKSTVYLEGREYGRLCKGHEVELALSDGHSVALVLDASVLAALKGARNGRAVAARVPSAGRVVACSQCHAKVKRRGLKQHIFKAHTAKGRMQATRFGRAARRRAQKGGAA